MKQQGEDLLLQVLCALLPYKPMVNADDGLSLDGKGSDYTLLGMNANKRIALLGLEFDDAYATHKEYLKNIKPYLRPMESMTDKEKKELIRVTCGKGTTKYFQVLPDGSIDNTDSEIQDLNKFEVHWINFNVSNTTAYINWLNANHFDCYGLIPMGFALEAPEGMYK